MGAFALFCGVDWENIWGVHLTLISSCYAFICIIEQSRCAQPEFLLDKTKAETVLQNDTSVPQPVMGIQSTESD